MATKKTGASGKAAPLEAKVADKLLDLLGTDNEFRRLFKKDPASALQKVGYGASVSHGDAAGDLERLAAQLKVERIAPKASITKAREEIKRSLTSGLDMQPIQLNVDSSATRRRRS